MPTKESKHVFARATPELLEMVRYLQSRWSGVAPATTSHVMTEAIRRAYTAEKKSEKKRQVPSNGA